MRRSVLIAAIAAVVLCVPASLVLESDGSDAATVYRLTGYVNEEFSSGNVGLAGVEVSIYSSDGTFIASGTTSSEDKGRFTIDMSSYPTTCYIAFSLEEYSLRSLSKYADDKNPITVNGLTAYQLSLPSPTTTEESGNTVRTYLITSDKADGLSCFTMATTTGEIIISVTHEGNGVIGAKVKLTSEDGTSYYGKTNSSGMFSMAGLIIGDYELEVSADGFETENITATVVKGSSQEQVELVKRDSATYLGMDLTHFLMFMCIVLGISVALSAMILRKRSDGNGPGN